MPPTAKWASPRTACNDAQNITWTFGTFFDSISESLKERIDDNQGQRISGRLTYLPYYDEPSNGRYLVHTGIGMLYTNDQDGLHRFRARPQIHEGPFLIDTGVLPIGEYTTGNVEFATVCGPFSVQSEAFLSSVNQITDDTVWVGGAYVYGSYFLTGENRIYERFGQHGAQFGRNLPFSNFFWVPGCCGPGAWEVKARWSNLNAARARGRANTTTARSAATGTGATASASCSTGFTRSPAAARRRSARPIPTSSACGSTTTSR